jgi:hypothetical protein
MGYNVHKADITVRLSSHNDERDERDAELWMELRGKIADLCADERYADISPYFE